MERFPLEIKEIIYRYSRVPTPPPNPVACSSTIPLNRWYLQDCPRNCNTLANPKTCIKWIDTDHFGIGEKCIYGYCNNCNDKILDNLIYEAKNHHFNGNFIHTIEANDTLHYSRNSLTNIIYRLEYCIDKLDYFPFLFIGFPLSILSSNYNTNLSIFIFMTSIILVLFQTLIQQV